MRVVLVNSLALRGKRVAEQLQARGACVEWASRPSHLHLRLMTGERTGLVVIHAEAMNGQGTQLAAELPLRVVDRVRPEIVLVGQPPNTSHALSAFEAGVNNWIPVDDSSILAHQYHFAQCIAEFHERGPRWNDAIEYLETLPRNASGLLEVGDGTLSAQITVRNGAIGCIHFPELQTSFTDSVEAELYTRCPEVDALRQVLGFPVYDWGTLLAAQGFWPRARFRDALCRRWQQAMRFIAGTQITHLQWHAAETRFSEELAFEPTQLLAALHEEIPHSLVRGRLSFDTLHVANDTALAVVS